MNRTLTVEDLATKMADGRTMFDYFVENGNVAISTLFHIDWYFLASEVDLLSALAKQGAKPKNIYQVLKSDPYKKFGPMNGRHGFYYTSVGINWYASINIHITRYLTLLFSFLEDGTLTDKQVLRLLISQSNNTHLGHGIARDGNDVVIQVYLKLLQRLSYKSQDVLGLMERVDNNGQSFSSLLQRNCFVTTQSRTEANALRIACLFDQLNNNQLSADDIKKHAADQSAILDHVMQLQPAEKKAALRKILDPQSQLGQFILVQTDGKPPSIKREHGLLFKALGAFSEMATDDDADFMYGLAVQLDGLIKNRDKRSPVVLKALMTLLQKSFSRTRPDDARMKAIFRLLKPENQKPSDVTLRSLVLGAYSTHLTQQYLDLLTDLCRYGMKADDLLTLVATPMQTWTKFFGAPTWVHITDLIAYHTSDAEKMARQLMNMVAGCFKDGTTIPQHHMLTLFQSTNLLSIGKVSTSYSSTKFLGLLTETDFFEAMKHAAPIQRVHGVAHQTEVPAMYPLRAVAPPAYHTHTIRQPAIAQPPSLAPLPSGYAYAPAFVQGQPQFIAAPAPAPSVPPPSSTAHMMMSLSVPMPAYQVMPAAPALPLAPAPMNTLQQHFELLRLPPAPREPQLEMPEFPTVPHQAAASRRQREPGF